MILDGLNTSAVSIAYQPLDMDAYSNFRSKFHNWISSSAQPVKALPGPGILVSGITDAFNQTYALYDRIGIFAGEYGYHKLVLGDRVTTDLDSADIIMVSHPYSADGMSAHDKLAIADSFDKPIFVDCAFFGICADISFDFSPYKNIHSVCFSLSKTFGTGHRRIGMLYTNDPYPATFYDEWYYHLSASAEHHYSLLDTMGPDDIFARYRTAQLEICQQLDAIASDTVIFGLDYHGRYPSQFRRGSVGRLCITKLLREKIQSMPAQHEHVR